MSPEVTLNRIAPALSPFLCSVVRNGRVGLDSTSCLRITDLKSGCTSLTPGPSCDRFKLHIPYAGETLKWDILFNAQYPELPPDFIFGEDAEFLPEPSALPSLAEWDASDPECLLQVVKELVQQYHQYQCSRLSESSRLMFEYQTLLEEPQYGENMEIYAGKKNNWTGEFSARFLLKLPVDFSNIPIYLLKDANEDPGEDVALLSVSFEDAEATQVFPKLFLSPRVEHALGGSSALHIPAFPSGGCLIDYVPQICQLLTNKVRSLAAPPRSIFPQIAGSAPQTGPSTVLIHSVKCPSSRGNPALPEITHDMVFPGACQVRRERLKKNLGQNAAEEWKTEP
ncbi:BRISC and BRCA1-A complex member 2 isoform X5 [Dendrobates tinctorius]|uniref:BRISC and BRCA1-A complex member 2 isoform X5 n=1 Tax=Dendrobates tinctorius TaxID=92724 RepID=UPI003CCA0A3C